ncbi:helix-turn-helix domain-containing protein [Pseudooceanicola marinus]|uniref:helix-turn-helix domain-containing protein n=1 Tax=Pseudooceanicola marinus TaxID=396013 RepID=UPI001CD5AF2E|nr:helix-turn-helix domain-containing protein [Pseudooceanicola marinus]MCA1337066.1 helix-turn-helix domain-containing protein [Pseudooceanicola marinus]
MIEKFTSSSIPTGRRLDFWNELCEQSLRGTTVDSESRAFRAEMWRLSLGDTTLLRPRSDASTVRRPADPTGCEGRSVVLHMQVGGRSRMQLRDRTIDLAPGDFVLTDAGHGYVFDLSQGHDLIVVEMPMEVLQSRIDGLAGHLDRAQTIFTPGGRLFREFLFSLWRQDDIGAGDPVFGQGASQVLADLWVMALRQGQEEPQALKGRKEALRQRILAFMDAELFDPELTIAQIASEFSLSPRSLQALFSEMGTTPTRYILSKRLDRAADCLLAEPGRSVTEIAFEQGFNDSAYFARRFRAQFGVTPTQWRQRT